MHHNEEVFIDEMSLEKIAEYLTCFSNWKYITSNDGRSITLWEKEPIYTWNGWENPHDSPIVLSLNFHFFFGSLSMASKMIYKRDINV